MSPLARLWHEYRLALLVFVAAAAMALFFGVRTAVFWVYWSDPAHRDMAIEGWMTPGYVARSWQVEREVVGEALGLAPGTGGRLTLAEIAAARDVSLDEIEAGLMAAVAAARAAQ